MSWLTLLCVAGFFAIAPGARAAEFHVATSGSDSNPGTQAAPLRTIQHAADLAQPGDVITVHEGVYRERINPPRGGESDTKRIVYQAAPGEKVAIKGSEEINNWVHIQDDVWKTTLPNAFFGSFNPYADLIHGDWFEARGRQHHTGAVYLNGEWFTEATKLDEVLNPNSAPSVPVVSLMNVAWIRPAHGSDRIAADRFTDKHGIKTATCSEGGQCLGWIQPGDWVRYEKVDFGERTEQMEIRAASITGGGIIELHLDSPTGELLGTCSVVDTGDWQSWASFQAAIKPTGGVKNLCLVFTSNKTPLWFGQVDKENTTIWAQFKNVDPNKQRVEINVRQTVFYPDKPGRNYITVRGFTLRDAATPWAPPTAEQIGLIGTHWSTGWIIENNSISHSICSGVSLGKYGDAWDNKAESAEGYVGTIKRALENGWSKANIGHHIVRNNVISHCEQTGIVGSMGAAFSTISDNIIHNVHVRRLFGGAEMAGIKFHGAIDVVINHNHIYRTTLGIWLDWMAQGTRVTGNLLHDNGQDLFFEVDHGPILVDNNISLSKSALLTVSQGMALVHNLFTGKINVIPYDERQTPFHKAHSTEIADLHDNPCGDARYYNNVFIGASDLSIQYDTIHLWHPQTEWSADKQAAALQKFEAARLPSWMDGNVFLKGAMPSKVETHPLLKTDFDPQVKLIEKPDGWHLEFAFDKTWGAEPARKLVTTELLGKASIPNLPFENADGSPVSINTDYFGKPRNESNPTSGPFEQPGDGRLDLKVW